MNKFSLGTIVGAALLGVSKKLGSKSEAVSAKIDRVYSLEFRWVMSVPGTTMRFPPSMIGNQILEELLYNRGTQRYPALESLPIKYITSVSNIEIEATFDEERDDYPDFEGDEDSEERERLWAQFDEENPQDIHFIFETLISFATDRPIDEETQEKIECTADFEFDIAALLSNATKYPFQSLGLDTYISLIKANPIISLFDPVGNPSILPQSHLMKLRNR
jgi:hypothetical protein